MAGYSQFTVPVAFLALAGVLGAPPHVAAQDLIPPGPPPAEAADSAAISHHDTWTPPISNLLLGGVILGTLASLELELGAGLDEAFGSDPGGSHSALRAIPRVVGSNRLQIGAAGLVALFGVIADDDKARRVGVITMETLAFTGLATIGLKAGIGRSRPGDGRDDDVFRVFTTTNSYWSYPSGHTSTAFALATVLTLELGADEPWIPYVAYPLATWVGVSRVQDQRHWPTDIIAGAALGILGAQLWHGMNRPGSDPSFGLRPLVASEPGGGLILGLSLRGP